MTVTLTQRSDAMKQVLGRPIQGNSQYARRRITHRPSQQKGMGLTGWLFFITVFGFSLTVSMKILPLYIDHSTMIGVMEGMTEQRGMAARSNSEIDKILDRRFKVNNILDFDYDDNVTMTRKDDSVTIILAYEVRVPLIQNIDLIVYFDDSVELKD
jgi:hypothetical protein